jgi:hypothetical protein
MTARQFVLKEPAAIFFIRKLQYNYGDSTMVIAAWSKKMKRELARRGADDKSHDGLRS